MSRANPADAMHAHLMERLRGAMDRIGAGLAEDIRESVSVPVGRSGGKVVRSKAGEPPRRETSGYRATIRHATRVEGDRVVTEAGTSEELGEWLEKGTGTMAARPHYEPARRRLAAQMPGILKQELSQP